MDSSSYEKELNESKNYGDIFEVVKRAVKQSIGRERAGLMLYLGNLPLHVGGLHGVGSNGIVLNKRLLKLVSNNFNTELNSYIFMLLLHEYLHSLGYIDEKQVKTLAYEISKEKLGYNHPATHFALNPPIPKIHPSDMQIRNEDVDLEIIRDFERSSLSYIN